VWLIQTDTSFDVTGFGPAVGVSFVELGPWMFIILWWIAGLLLVVYAVLLVRRAVRALERIATCMERQIPESGSE
jgi:hypothetical protein